MEAGQKVEILIGLEPYFKKGDVAVLTVCDEEGWWADIEGGMESRFIGQPGVHFLMVSCPRA